MLEIVVALITEIMETKFGFTLMTVNEFEAWINAQNLARTVLYVQEHHTFSPDYGNFRGDNHFDLQKAMKNYHVHNNGWRDIGQHFTIFPDGKICTGRSLESSPACILGNNSHAICIENLGNFDAGKDAMNTEQQDAIVSVTASLCKRFNIPINTDRIVYHHWFDLNTGARTNGTGVTKTCPGTAFFGGNTVADCQQNFLPLVQAAFQGTPPDGTTTPPHLKMYGSVTANQLNIRDQPSGSGNKIGLTTLGAIVRVYEVQNGWYKISQSKQEWVYGHYVQQVQRATVTADHLNVRNGPSAQFSVVGVLEQDKEVFIYETQQNWARIGIDAQWVSHKFLKIVA